MNKKILIIGASRGLGFGLVNRYLKLGFDVIATERKYASSTELKKLQNESNGNLQVEQLDINKYEQIKELRKKLASHSFDILFVNAGVCDDQTQPIGQISNETFDWVMHTNALSPMRVIETFDDLVTKKGTVGVMTSGLGSIASNSTGGYELYRASKAALNMLLKSYTIRKGHERSVIAMMPGWVKTDMGGPQAPLDVETSVTGIANSIELHSGKSGIKFIDYQNKSIPW